MADRPVVDTVFLILGRGCNLSCRYCLQHDLVDSLPAEVDPRVPAFIRRLVARQGSLRLQLYGGEPLVYMGTVRQLVDQLADLRGQLTWTMITNGRLLDDATVDWCNDTLDGVAVSWDGPASTVTRGYDVVAQRRAQLLRLRRLTLSGVVSAAAYPLSILSGVDTFDEAYVARQGVHVNVNLDELLSVTDEHPELGRIDFDELRRQVEVICAAYEAHVLHGRAISHAQLTWVTRKVRNLRHGVRCGVGTRARCGNGYTVLNLDMAGYLYACHNTSLRVGSVDDPWDQVHANVVAADATPTHAPVCALCDARWMCQNGCPLVTRADRELFYCQQVRAMAEPVMDTVLRLGDALAARGEG